MSFNATTYLLPYSGSDRVLKIQSSTLVKVGGFNVCQYIKSATEEKELIIFTSLGQLVLDFLTEADAKLAQNILNVAVEALIGNCSVVIPPTVNPDLETVLGVGNSTGNIDIVSPTTAGLLTVSDTFLEFSLADPSNRFAGAATRLAMSVNRTTLEWTDGSIDTYINMTDSDTSYYHAVQNTFDAPIHFFTNGDVGIGIAIPLGRLHVNTDGFPQNVIFSSDNSGSTLTLNSGSAGFIGSGGSGVYLQTTGSTKGEFYSNSSVGATFLSSGGGYSLVLSNASNQAIGLGVTGNNIIFNTGGVLKMIIDGVTSNVGIGIASPTAKLHIAASGAIPTLLVTTTSAHDASIKLLTNSAATARANIYVEDSTQTLNFYTLNNDTIFWNGNGLAQTKTLTLYTNTSAKFESFLYVGTNITLDGMDTTNYPITVRSARNDLTRVQILNGGATQTDLQIGTNNSANSIYYGMSAASVPFIDNRSGGNLQFQNTGTTQITFSTAGKVGIGIVPTYTLDVSSTNSNTFRSSAVGTFNNFIVDSNQYSSTISVNAATAGPIGGYNAGLYLNSNGVFRGSFNAESTTSVTTLESAGGYWLWLKNGTAESIALGAGGNYISFNTNGVTNMLVEGSTGNIAIGTALAPTSRLHIKGSGATSATFALKVDNTSSTPLLYARNDGNIALGDPTNLSSKFIDFNSVSNTFRINVNTTSNLHYNVAGELFLTGINGTGGHDMQITSIAAKSQNLVRGSSGKRLAFAAVTNADIQISATGNVYIGVDGVSGVDAAERLEVNGNILITSKTNKYKIDVYDALALSQGIGSPNIIVGHGNTMNDADNGGGIVIGFSSTSSSDGIAIGLSTIVASGTVDGIAIGRSATVNNSSIRGVAIGREALVTASNAFAIGNYTTANVDDTIIIGNNGSGNKPNIGIAISSPTAKLHIKGIDSTSSNYAFKVDNSTTNMFSIRNDGIINASALPTSNAGLSTGDFYIDTAANILANGDKVVGIKV